MAILRVRDDKGNITDIPAIKGEKGDKGDKGDSAVTDQTYNPKSANAQSGKAVYDAIKANIDTNYDSTSDKAQSGIAVSNALYTYTEQTYNPTSFKPQSGVAVTEAIFRNTDDMYSPTSPNPQNGFAVAEAINLSTDQTYNPESENAQSGVAVAEAISSLGNGDVFVTVADITVEEAVNAITIDETAFPDIGKLKDFYISFSIAKPETVQSGNLLIMNVQKWTTPSLGVIKTWNNASYVLSGSFYSKRFDDNFRFNFVTETFSANELAAVNLATTTSKITSPLQSLVIRCQTATSTIPVGSKIVIKGFVGR